MIGSWPSFRKSPATSPDGQRRGTVLHIGTMKSGTSYLQDVLDDNRRLLAAAGVRYLGRGTRAVWDVLELRADQSEHSGAWDKLVASAAGAKEPMRLLSMEILSTAGDDQAREVVASFGPGPVEVILTVRDLVRVIPSAWQNAIKHGGKASFEEFVEAVVDPAADRPVGERFWRQHDVARIAERWASLVGAENVHVVTLPPSGAAPDVLWGRFCSVLGLDHTAFPPGPARPGNASLSYSDAELLRRLNRRIGGDLGRLGYNRYVRTFLAHEIMREDPVELPGAPSDTPVLAEGAYRWAISRSHEITDALAASGVHVVGDLADLVPRTFERGSYPTPVGPQVTYPDTVVRAMATLLRKLAEIDPETNAGRPAPRDDQVRRRTARRVRNQGGRGSGAARAGSRRSGS